MSNTGLHGITRVDSPKARSHGYYVRLTYGGISVAKWFADIGKGGQEDALHAAIEFRNQARTFLCPDATKRRKWQATAARRQHG